LWRIVGPKRAEDGSWRELYNDELHSLYSSPNSVRVNKLRKMRWAGYVARMGRGDVFKGFWLGDPKGRDYWEDLGVVGKLKLKWTLGREASMKRTGFGWLGIVSSSGLCEHENEADSIKKEDIL